jgi:hypothetical protein
VRHHAAALGFAKLLRWFSRDFFGLKCGDRWG